MGGVQKGVPRSPVDMRVEGVYSHTSHDTTKVGVPSGTTKLYGGLASVVYNVGPKALMRPAFVLGVGGEHHPDQDLGAGGNEDGLKWPVGGGGGGCDFVAAGERLVDGRCVSVRG